MSAAEDNPVLTAYRRNYIRAQYTWVQMFTEHLTDCSRVFNGDLQAMLILAIIGQSYLFKMMKDGHQELKPGSIPILEGTSINASSLAAVLEIPRETVRRKLTTLADQGWIEKVDDGWRLVIENGETKARSALDELDQRSMTRIAKLVGDFNSLALKSPTLPADRRRQDHSA